MGSESIAPTFLTTAVDGGEWSASRPGRFPPRLTALDTHWIGGWVGPRAGLDAVEYRQISYPHLQSNPGHPDLSPSLYRLSYTGFHSSGWDGYLMLYYLYPMAPAPRGTFLIIELFDSILLARSIASTCRSCDASVMSSQCKLHSNSVVRASGVSVSEVSRN
jgi:hypothetical protein